MGFLNLLAGIPVNANLRLRIAQLEAELKSLKEQYAILQSENENLKVQNAELGKQVKRLTKGTLLPNVTHGKHPYNGGLA